MKRANSVPANFTIRDLNTYNMTINIIMSLVDLVDNSKTDKNTWHSYLPLYESLFSSKKNSATHILEIGIGPFYKNNGGSINLWSKYFNNATIFALDIIPFDAVDISIINNPKIYLYTASDAYDINFFTKTFINTQLKFDILLDDGPHTLESMITFIILYSNLLKDDGILVIEDVQDIQWIEIFKTVTPIHLKQYIEVYDRRNIKGRYDDIVFVINKSKTA